MSMAPIGRMGYMDSLFAKRAKPMTLERAIRVLKSDIRGHTIERSDQVAAISFLLRYIEQLHAEMESFVTGD